MISFQVEEQHLISRIMKYRLTMSEYGRYVAREFLDYLSYVNALLIGAALNYFSGHGLPGLAVPYLVPLGVQVISKSMVKYRNRHLRRLIQLPAEREDPAFIMDEDGNVLLATGVTRQTFNRFNVENIKDLIGEGGFAKIRDDLNRSTYRMENIYSSCNEKWYEVRIKPVELGGGIREYLVWFIDISGKKNYELRILSLLKFSGSVHARIREGLEKDEIYAILAEFVLKNDYRGVYMSRLTRSGIIAAYCFRMQEGRLVRSESILRKSEGQTAEIILRESSEVVMESIDNYDSPDDFISHFPFDKSITSFLGENITNFVSFHDERVSLIGFNKTAKAERYDLIMMEIMANNIRSLLDIVDSLCYTLNKKNGKE